MAEIILCRQAGVPPISDEDRATVKRVLFGYIDGLSEAHKKSWHRLIAWLITKAEPGQLVEIKTNRERIGFIHRKHMALETRLFDQQERFTDFEQFRNWLKIGAGFVDWVPGPKGAVAPIPRSISYAKCEQEEFDQFHDKLIAFVREPHALKVMYPQLHPHVRLEMVDSILNEFHEFIA